MAWLQVWTLVAGLTMAGCVAEAKLAGVSALGSGAPGSESKQAAERAGWPMHIMDRHLRNPDGLEMADLNGDGLLDFCTAWDADDAITIGIHPGPERLSEAWPVTQVATVGAPDEAIFWDLDQDGYEDVLYTQGPDMPVSGIGIVWNPGPDHIRDPEAWDDAGLFPATELRKQFLVLLPTDVNGDGRDDLVAAGIKGTPVVWIESPARNRRDLSDYKLHVIRDVPTNSWTAALSDIDGDGDVDIVLAESDANSETVQQREGVHWLENPGKGSAEQKLLWPAHTIRAMDVDRRSELVQFDLDGDGHDDLAINGRSKIDLWRKTSVKPLAWEHSTITKPANVAERGTGLAAHDIDGDGHMNLVGSSVNNEYIPEDQIAVYWLSYKGDGADANWEFHAVRWGYGPGHGGIGEKWERIRFADVDGDGDDDLVMNEKELWTARPREGDGQSLIGIVWFENRL